MGELIDNGSIVVLILAVFMAGFIFKVIYTLCYNEILDKIECKNFRQCKIINHIVEGYESENKDRVSIKNTGAYVQSELNKWKKWGLYVERMNDYGNAAVNLCIMIGAIVDMYIISNYNSGNLQVPEVVIQVTVYSFIPIICLIAVRMWDYAVGIEYKKKIIYEEIVNYIDNRLVYVKINTDGKIVDEIIHEGRSEEDKFHEDSSQKNSIMESGIEENNNTKNSKKQVEKQNKDYKDTKQASDGQTDMSLKENEKMEVINQVLNEYL